jgi:hypothetical protein
LNSLFDTSTSDSELLDNQTTPQPWLTIPITYVPFALSSSEFTWQEKTRDAKDGKLTFNRQNAEEAAELKKKRQFRKFSYRGIDLDAYVSPICSFPDSRTSTAI